MNDAKGFTLVEMAVVLVIMGLLLGGILMPLATQMEQRRIQETRQAMDQIKEALLGFAIVNGRFPCPARPATATGTSFGGFSAGEADCANAVGVLPWATLGLPETDAWGRRYSYRVSLNNDFTTPFGLASVGDMTVLDTLSGQPIATQVPVIIVSHGNNGFNAWLPSGVQMAASTDGDENANDMADTTFVNKTPTAAYDDLVAWIPSGVLINRMVAAGTLP